MPPTKTKNSDKFESQFINVTNSVFLDSKARTSVRSQVMREYHRRRTQKHDDPGSHNNHGDGSQVPLSAKEQTQRYRLDGKKTFKAWLPVTLGDYRMSSDKEGTRKTEKSARETHSIRKANLLSNETNNALPSVSNEEDLPKKFKELQDLLARLSLATSVTRAPAIAAIDPFDSVSLLLDSRTQLLLHHYFNQRLHSSWLMMPMRKGLFSIAVHDAALFHTFLAHYVASYDLRYGAGDPAESLYHRMEAVRIVNERLATAHNTLSDGTIAAVANMAVYEASNGSLDSMAVHLKGLEEMVNMRGGILEGGFDPNVRRLIAWTDLHCANALSQPTRFPPLSVARYPDSPLSQMNIDAEDRNLQSSIANSLRTDLTLISEQSLLEWTMSEVRDMSLSLQHVRCSSSTPQENIWYSDKVYYLQFCLLEVLHSPKSSHLEVATSIAALIYCSVCFRDLSFNFRVVGETVVRLEAVLQNVFYEAANLGKDYENLLWSLIVGGMAAEGKPEREWFVVQLAAIGRTLSIMNWDGCKGMLRRLSWQVELDSFGSRLWREACATSIE
ncbi:uncharacterized protein LY89DRAFT_151350 [Mollisia scopiformis]|uniref:Uncharacterized protein n=1 Tax=Mollisia scopiformis TaxID=149040 RepID=A0A194X1V3_MOLSC|nr:uncharacterized protein LY89DRAFT_151350 [Mollisia scopiformis]KUJ13964.1 hypothetical protein LY89DRAFT_151350 [Mollisia scopiformis]